MGKLTFDEAQQIAKERENQGGDISFFTLKNHKDTAVIRILHSELRDIESLAIHYARTAQGKNRAISCCRGSKEPIENCPLCAANRQGENMQVRYYIHLLEYKMENGQMVGTHKVFDRGQNFITQLESYASRYKPMHAHLFEIERIGEAGSRETKYNLIPLPDSENEKYPYYEDDLEYVPALGTVVADKSFADVQYFVENGSFPEDSNNQDANASAQAPAYAPRAAAPAQGPVSEMRRREDATASVGTSVTGPRRRV